MHCPFCGADNTQVTDTRENEDGDIVRRRRRCLSCDKRFTTYERIDLKMPQVVKKNGSRTDYNHDKLVGSLSLALRKRPVTAESVDAAVDRIVELNAMSVVVASRAALPALAASRAIVLSDVHGDTAATASLGAAGPLLAEPVAVRHCGLGGSHHRLASLRPQEG